MRFYTHRHKYYCGIDLHASYMYVCIMDRDGDILLHKNLKTRPELFLAAVAPYKEDLVVGSECVFLWYWLADLCEDHGITFKLGHALYMKAIHGGKAKNDRIDSRKIAALLAGGNFPLAYTYPRGMRSTRDLLRRRNYLVRHRAELDVHAQNTATQYNLPPFGKRIDRKTNREGFAERFPDHAIRKNVELDMTLMDHFDQVINSIENEILRTVRRQHQETVSILKSVPGIGKILSLVILFEIHDISRFPTVQQFASYARLVKCQHRSAGKLRGTGGAKIGNAHLKWALSEAAALFLRGNQKAQKLKARLERKHGEGKSMSIITHKLGRAIYYMLKRKTVFQPERFYSC